MYKMRLAMFLLLSAAVSGLPNRRPYQEATETISSISASEPRHRRADQFVDMPAFEALGLAHSSHTTTPASVSHPARREIALDVLKRATDVEAAGGNAFTGDTGDVDGGSINNIAGPDNTITNDGGNIAGDAGQTVSGDAIGGRGRNRGPGGNAYTGETGTANGGFVNNEAGVINNMGPGNNAGNGGLSQSGEATGGVSY